MVLHTGHDRGKGKGFEVNIPTEELERMLLKRICELEAKIEIYRARISARINMVNQLNTALETLSLNEKMLFHLKYLRR